MSEQNIAVVRRAVDEIWNRGNYAALDELVSNDILIHSATPSGEIRGHEGLRQFYTALRAGFPDIHFTIEDQVTQGDKVVTRWSAQATHLGEYHGIQPTHRSITFTGIDIDQLANGKVVECWPITDEVSILVQLGVFTMPGQVGV